MRFDPSLQPFNPKSGNLLQQTPWLKRKKFKGKIYGKFRGQTVKCEEDF